MRAIRLTFLNAFFIIYGVLTDKYLYKIRLNISYHSSVQTMILIELRPET
jgi:hypothetical protein